jgi:hypothetical protein
MPPTEATLRAIKQYQPEVFLLSGGGTDIAGSELASYLNHKSSTLLVLPEDYVQYASSTVAQRAYTMDPEGFCGPLWGKSIPPNDERGRAEAVA